MSSSSTLPAAAANPYETEAIVTLIPTCIPENRAEESPKEHTLYGHCDIRIGQHLKDGRYKILRKLG